MRPRGAAATRRETSVPLAVIEVRSRALEES